MEYKKRHGTKGLFVRPILPSIVGAFAKLRKATIAFAMNVRPSLRPSVRREQLRFHWTDIHEI